MTGSLRILHLSRRYAPFVGGTERYVRDLASAQAGLGRAVTVLTLDRDVVGGSGGRLPTLEVMDGVRIRRVPGLGSRRTAFPLRPDLVLGEIRDHDVVHLHDLRFAVGLTALTARLVRRPLLVHTHGLIFHEPALMRVKRAAMRGYYGPLLRLAAAVVASSESDRLRLVGLVPALASRTAVFENAIPIAPLSSLQRQPVEGTILVLGRVAPSKGIDDLIEALTSVRDQQWRLVIAGESAGLETRRLRTLAAAAGVADRVEFRGAFAAAELPDLLSTAAIAVFPSRGEGFGLALLEAMAAGVPVLARAIPAHVELLGPGLEAQLSQFEPPEAAAPAISRLLSLPPEEATSLSTRLRARAAGYDISRLVGQIDSLYRRLGVRVPDDDVAG